MSGWSSIGELPISVYQQVVDRVPEKREPVVVAAKMYKFLGVCLLAVVLCGLPSLTQGELGSAMKQELDRINDILGSVFKYSF